MYTSYSARSPPPNAGIGKLGLGQPRGVNCFSRRVAPRHLQVEHREAEHDDADEAGNEEERQADPEPFEPVYVHKASLVERNLNESV